VEAGGQNMNDDALGVDVADLQVESLAQAQAAGVDGGQGDAMVDGGDRRSKRLTRWSAHICPRFAGRVGITVLSSSRQGSRNALMS